MVLAPRAPLSTWRRRRRSRDVASTDAYRETRHKSCFNRTRLLLCFRVGVSPLYGTEASRRGDLLRHQRQKHSTHGHESITDPALNSGGVRSSTEQYGLSAQNPAHSLVSHAFVSVTPSPEDRADLCHGTHLSELQEQQQSN